MLIARIALVAFGILLPYLARLHGMATHGPKWMNQYTGLDIEGTLFLGCLCAATWGGLLAFSFLLRHPSSVLITALLGFAFPFHEHATLDLASDAQAGIYVIFIHIYAIPFVILACAVGWVFDRWLSRRADLQRHP